MRRLAVVLFLLSPSYALAGQASSSFGVGLIITGPSNAPAPTQKTAAGATDASTTSAQPAKKTRVGPPLVLHNSVPPNR